MIHDPRVLILDEPTSGLDPIEIIEIRNLIRELGKKKTVILSTHILPEVEATCGKVIIINRGKIVADDATSKLQSSTGRDRNIIIRVSGTGFEGLESMLKSVQGVSNVARIDDSELTSAIATVSGITDVRADIFHAVCGKGWVMYEMKQEHTSLENIFRELTTGGANEQV
jgi:ABC-2 type transport system ATP-binding protein